MTATGIAVTYKWRMDTIKRKSDYRHDGSNGDIGDNSYPMAVTSTLRLRLNKTITAMKEKAVTSATAQQDNYSYERKSGDVGDDRYSYGGYSFSACSFNAVTDYRLQLNTIIRCVRGTKFGWVGKYLNNSIETGERQNPRPTQPTKNESKRAKTGALLTNFFEK